MKTTRGLLALALAAASMLAFAGTLTGTSHVEAQTQRESPPVAAVRPIPLVWGEAVPVALQSDGVEWRSNVFHLVQIGSARFELDKSDRLKAELKVGVTTFDDVDYDIGGAVFDTAGKLLGVATAPCKVERLWLGVVMQSGRTITLDFGVSLDYTNASSFLLSVSKRKVLTPDFWQK